MSFREVVNSWMVCRIRLSLLQLFTRKLSGQFVLYYSTSYNDKYSPESLLHCPSAWPGWDRTLVWPARTGNDFDRHYIHRTTEHLGTSRWWHLVQCKGINQVVLVSSCRHNGNASPWYSKRWHIEDWRKCSSVSWRKWPTFWRWHFWYIFAYP